MMRKIYKICWLRTAIGWKNCTAIEQVNIVSESMTSGGYALNGVRVETWRWKSLTTIREEENTGKLPPVHPGEVLLEDFMKPLGLSQYRVAKDVGVSPIRISQIIHGKRAITADTAIRLSYYFGTSAEVWLRLQARYDLEVAQGRIGERIKQEVRVLNAAESHR